MAVLAAAAKRPRLNPSGDSSSRVAGGYTDIGYGTDTRPLCRFFMQGSCVYGEYCHFRHEEEAEVEDTRPPCTFFAQGRCTRGASCHFSHAAVGNSGKAAQEPPQCTFWARGNCLRGSDCPFSHDDFGQSADLEVFGLDDDEEKAEGATAPESAPGPEQSSSLSAKDILRKYSASTRARDAGHDVRVKKKVQASSITQLDEIREVASSGKRGTLASGKASKDQSNGEAGSSNADVLLIADAPGETDDAAADVVATSDPYL
eukprot:TRINITY_DN2566_c0_g2_i1.p1 TRINITY_DN2566_c0_g2~~TRINITY_DN2566_c0_g2_i1.p1  ORF type:complete len:260 (-),score=33.23 TRINITY_DN2566_c0_g2_i1:243-1022(-)